MKPRPTDTPLDYVGQMGPNAKVPLRHKQALPRGRQLVVIRERFCAYIYSTRQSIRPSAIHTFTNMAFPNGCTTQVIGSTRK